MGSGFESQGAHFTENPADSSESAGFLRSLVNTVLRCEVHIILFALGFDARKTVFALVPTGNPSSLRFGHPDVTTGDTVFPRFVYLMSRRGISIPLRVCGSGVREIPPGLR